MTVTRRSVLALAALGLLATSACSDDPADASRPRGLPATGYALAGSATPAQVTRDGDYLRTIGISGVSLDGPAALTPVSADVTKLRRAAQKHGRQAVLLVSNFSSSLGDFDEEVAFEMLRSPANRVAVITMLVEAAKPFDGVQIDLESLTPRDAEGLTAFTAELRGALEPGQQLSMAFMASRDAKGYADRGYDLAALEPHLDRAVLMTYDQHGTWSGPGPIGSLSWVRRELDHFVSVLPRAKIDLGVAAYGYEWDGETTHTLTVGEARRRAGDAARWSGAAGEWTAEPGAGRTIWWSDRRSLAAREKIAETYGVHGVAIWQIGASGPLR